MASVEERIALVERQQSMQTEALQRLAMGRPDEAAVWINALSPGKVGTWEPMAVPVVPDAPARPAVQVVDVRGELPTRAGRTYYERPLDGITGVDVHYTASDPTASVEAIARYQTGPGAQEAFPAIAYHYVVIRDGTVYRCHDLATRVWHNAAPGANRTRVAVCWIGKGAPTAEQIRGMAWAIVAVQRELGRELTVSGHGDSYATSCPGPTWREWRGELVRAVEMRRGTLGRTTPG